MRYASTRSDSGETSSFEEALLRGYAPDGGLFVPCQVPTVSSSTLSQWSKLSYPDLVVEISKLFISKDEIPHHKLVELVRQALRPDMIAVKELASDCLVMELYHGKTLAFKDLAMSCTARFLDYFLEKRKSYLNIIVSTSGDTGAAAIEAIRGSQYMDLFVMYPLGRVTEIQELQMTTGTAAANNVHLFGLSGTSDDGDDVMRAIFEDKEFAAKHHVSNVNSINWCRVMIQTAHHFCAYFQASQDCSSVVEVVCPTGAAGNLAAGCVARAMGLPIRLVACVNENDLVHQMIETGTLTCGNVHETLASAMDIQMPYNIERILHVLSNGDPKVARDFAMAISNGKSFVVLEGLFSKMGDTFTSFKCTDAMIRGAIKRCWEEEKYLICPHTATALAYHYAKMDGSHELSAMASTEKTHQKQVCLATASYIKFPEALEASGVPVPPVALMDTLCAAPQAVTRLTDKRDWIPVLRASITKATERRQRTL